MLLSSQPEQSGGQCQHLDTFLSNPVEAEGRLVWTLHEATPSKLTPVICNCDLFTWDAVYPTGFSEVEESMRQAGAVYLGVPPSPYLYRKILEAKDLAGNNIFEAPGTPQLKSI